MKRQYLLWMIPILLIATLLRLGALPDLPLGLHYDEAANAILTQEIATQDYRPVFIRAYTGKEVLFFYAAAPWVWLTGNAALGVRLGAAMLGILTVAATFSATRTLFGPTAKAQEVALLAAAWMAVAFPHVLLSRYGFRAISQPLLQALTVATLWRGLRSGKLGWLIAGGITLGLTGYTYLAARLFPIPLGIALLWFCLRPAPRKRSQRYQQVALILLAALIAFAPLGVYFLGAPEAFMTRINQVAAATWKDALHGIWLCVRAIAWPGAGDGYVRFNDPGRPLLGFGTALLALVGLVRIAFSRRADSLDGVTRLFVLLLLPLMLLPSALATSEITPSNLRLVGLFPFLMILPALGTSHLLSKLPARKLKPLALSAVLLMGGISNGAAYFNWARSTDLFYNADGVMVLAAEVLDNTDFEHTSVYLASEHYRHPTVAALARNYPQAKWLTGGASLVLPLEGDALYVIPANLAPPAPWPAEIQDAWELTTLPDPHGDPALLLYRLTEAAIAKLRPAEPAADFAHVLWVYDAHFLKTCHAAEHCPVLMTWEAKAPYSSLDPVLRVLHPHSGEWARTTAFHYPPEQWTPGDLVLDQFVFDLPREMPPGEEYQLGVGFYNPDDQSTLPRLINERFSGLDVRFPLTAGGFEIAAAAQAPNAAQIAAACADIPRREALETAGLHLLGWTEPPAALLPGERFEMRLCWQGGAENVSGDLTLTLLGPQTYSLYEGAPAGGYAFAVWSPGAVIEDRHTLQIPRDSAPGTYALNLSIDGQSLGQVGQFEVAALARRFDIPEIPHPLQEDFGAAVRLRGYNLDPLQAGKNVALQLYWQSLNELEENYTVFVHLLDANSGTLVTQIDEIPHSAGQAYPTSLWIRDEIVIDEHILMLPPDLPDGTYNLRVGLYLQENGTHLLVNETRSLLLADIKVGP